MSTVNRLEEHLKEIPEGVKVAVKALSDDTRLAIIVVLLKYGECTFSQLMETLEIDSGVLSHHLKNLLRASLIKNYYIKKPDSEDYSFYDLTYYGEGFMRSVYGMWDANRRFEDAIARACISSKPYGVLQTNYTSGYEGVVYEVEKTRARLIFMKKPEMLARYKSKMQEE